MSSILLSYSFLRLERCGLAEFYSQHICHQPHKTLSSREVLNTVKDPSEFINELSDC
jgi:hypothetical protein